MTSSNVLLEGAIVFAVLVLLIVVAGPTLRRSVQRGRVAMTVEQKARSDTSLHRARERGPMTTTVLLALAAGLGNGLLVLSNGFLLQLIGLLLLVGSVVALLWVAHRRRTRTER
jgi:hypothetical protein